MNNIRYQYYNSKSFWNILINSTCVTVPDNLRKRKYHLLIRECSLWRLDKDLWAHEQNVTVTSSSSCSSTSGYVMYGGFS